MKIRLKLKNYFTKSTISLDKLPSICYIRLTERNQIQVSHTGEVNTISNTALFRFLTDMKKNHLSDLLQELSVTEFTTLHVLKRGHFSKPDGEITVSHLATYTDSSLSAVSRTLSQLEKAQLISREIGGSYRRSVSVTLTPQGKEMLTREEERLKSFRVFLYDTMGEEDVATLFSLMERFHSVSEEGIAKLSQKRND